MAYCLFNSSNCDVYVYEDVSGGWTTHVAGNHIYKGRTYNSSTAGECAQLLERLLQKGIRVPMYAINELWEEHTRNGKAHGTETEI